MPIEPPLPRWALPDRSDLLGLPPGEEFVAVGADLSPGMLLAGYRSGLFAMPDRAVPGWWCPDPRGVLLPAAMHVSRSLRRALGSYEVSVDAAFDAVLTQCADPGRPHGWISTEYERSYRVLHGLGWAHSVEVWAADGTLAGGMFGVEVGGLFAAESKFHARTDASKVAVVALAALLGGDGDSRRIIDVQWCTEHLATLGAGPVPRELYLRALPAALACPPVLCERSDRDLGQLGPPGAAAFPAASRIRWR
ncbi:MAG: leucyl/phenylalanyl-tRNA--protein transferase [Candidatus Nanopelagicales bacterium]